MQVLSRPNLLSGQEEGVAIALLESGITLLSFSCTVSWMWLKGVYYVSICLGSLSTKNLETRMPPPNNISKGFQPQPHSHQPFISEGTNHSSPSCMTHANMHTYTCTHMRAKFLTCTYMHTHVHILTHLNAHALIHIHA